MPTSLVIGGAGFIGAHLVRGLVSAGHHCIVLDNGSGLAGRRPLPREVDLVSADAASLSQLHLGPIDYVLYLAARCGGILFNTRHQAEMFWSNIHSLAGLAHSNRLRPKRLIFFSTACVYPSWALVPTSEIWGYLGLPERTNLGYGLAKRVGEMIAVVWRLLSKTPTFIVRPSNTFGPWDYFHEDHGHFVPSVLLRMVRGDPVVRVWGGSQTRAFVYVGDVAAVTLQLLKGVAGNSTLNIGHPTELSIRDAAAIMQDETGYRGSTEFTPGPTGYRRRAADERRLRAWVGPFSWMSFREGIRRTVSWIRSDEGEAWMANCSKSRLTSSY